MSDETEELAIDLRVEVGYDDDKGIYNIQVGTEGVMLVGMTFGATGRALAMQYLASLPEAVTQALAAIDAEIAKAADEEDGLPDAAVVGTSPLHGNGTPGAVVVEEPPREHLAAALDPAHRPRGVAVVGTSPLHGNGTPGAVGIEEPPREHLAAALEPAHRPAREQCTCHEVGHLDCSVHGD